MTLSGPKGKYHDQANDVVDVDGKCIKNAITYFSHVRPVMLICDMHQAGQGLLYFRYRGATKGAEQFCYGILDADMCPPPLL